MVIESPKTLQADQIIYSFKRADLIPYAWNQSLEGGVRAFNPTITTNPTGYTICYRIVPTDGSYRKIATCKLDRDFNVIPDTAVALSDEITFTSTEGLNDRALTWHADPRYQRIQGRLYILWNDGGNTPINNQFLMEMNADGTRPAGPAKALKLYGMKRRSTEKNWMFFDSGDKTYVVYSISPHIILEASFNHPNFIVCFPACKVEWDDSYQDVFGVMRGGAQPVEYHAKSSQATMLSLSHSSYKTTKGRIYEAFFYEFLGQRPFSVMRSMDGPIKIGEESVDGFEYKKLNNEVHSVVYPCGLLIEGSDAIVSYGINDETMAIARIRLETIESCLKSKNSVSLPIETITILENHSPTHLLSSSQCSSMPAIPLFWWDSFDKKLDPRYSNRRFKTGNFGDIASRDIFERITKIKTVPPRKGLRKVLSVGSVLHNALDGDIIWGSGIKDASLELKEGVRSLNIRAVRGPLSLEFLRLRGFDISQIMELFDPGCLINEIFSEEISTYDSSCNEHLGSFRIIPHYRDDLLMRRMYPNYLRHFLSVDCSPISIIQAMLGAQVIYSSSLHGIIFAESLGIPAYWLKSIGGEGSYKFYDYYYGTGRFQVKCFSSLEDAFKSEPMPLPVRRPDTYLSTFPHDLIHELLVDNGLEPGTRFFPRMDSLDQIARIMSYSEEHCRIGRSGMWFLGRESVCGLRLDLKGRSDLVIDLTIKPLNHERLPSPQEGKLIVSGRYCISACWDKGDRTSKTLSFPVIPPMLESGLLILEFQAKHAVPPADIGLGKIKDPLSICIESIELHSHE